MNKFIYRLSFDDDTGDLTTYYVGCTNDPDRRQTEHKNAYNNTKHPEYNTNKYTFMRELQEMGIKWHMDVISEVDEDSEDSEYAQILAHADINEKLNIDYYGYPLTNMKAGDFLSEMLAEKFPRTVAGVQLYKRRAAEKKRQIEYDRFKDKGFVPNAAGIVLPAPLTKADIKASKEKRKIFKGGRKKAK